MYEVQIAILKPFQKSFVSKRYYSTMSTVIYIATDSRYTVG